MLPLGVVANPSVLAGQVGDASVWRKPRFLKLKRALSNQRSPFREPASSHIRGQSEVFYTNPVTHQCVIQTLIMRYLDAFA